MELTEKILKQADLLEVQLEKGLINTPLLQAFIKEIKATARKKERQISKSKFSIRNAERKYLEKL